MEIQFLIRLVLLMNGLFLSYHPVHVSVTNIELKSSEYSIEYSIRIFADDFEYALIHLFEKEISFKDGISPEEQKLVVDYINSRFGIIVDDLKCQPEILDIMVQDNSTWLYFRALLPEKEINTIKITNQVLLDFFPDQTNLIIFTIDEKQTGYTFDYLNQETEIIVNRPGKSNNENQ